MKTTLRAPFARAAVCALLACSTPAVSLQAGTVGTGFSSTANGDPDGFPGAKGAGWTGIWQKGILPGPQVPAQIRSEAPLGDGGTYLRAVFSGIRVDSGFGRSFARGYGPAAIEVSQKVVFEFRVRLEPDTLGFAGAGDYLTVQCNDQGTVGSSNGSTWIISVFGGSPGTGLPGMEWLLYDGQRNSGAYDKNAWIRSGMPVKLGTVYALRVTCDPKSGSYDVEIQAGGETVTRTGLGFRTGAKKVGNTLGIFSKLDTNGDALVVALDDVVVTNNLRRR